MTVDLTPEEARYLSVLAAHDIRSDREHGLGVLAERHLPVWEKLQPACEWEVDK